MIAAEAEHRSSIGRFVKGFKHSPESRQKISKSLQDQYANGTRKVVRMTGKDSPTWKGDAIGYSMIHRWMKQTFGQPTECEDCGKTVESGSKIHWANKSGKYKRERIDWMRLCMRCHMIYDFKTGQRK